MLNPIPEGSSPMGRGDWREYICSVVQVLDGVCKLWPPEELEAESTEDKPYFWETDEICRPF